MTDCFFFAEDPMHSHSSVEKVELCAVQHIQDVGLLVTALFQKPVAPPNWPQELDDVFNIHDDNSHGWGGPAPWSSIPLFQLQIGFLSSFFFNTSFCGQWLYSLNSAGIHICIVHTRHAWQHCRSMCQL
jgi:hypothetical protein